MSPMFLERPSLNCSSGHPGVLLRTAVHKPEACHRRSEHCSTTTGGCEHQPSPRQSRSSRQPIIIPSAVENKAQAQSNLPDVVYPPQQQRAAQQPSPLTKRGSDDDSRSASGDSRRGRLSLPYLVHPDTAKARISIRHVQSYTGIPLPSENEDPDAEVGTAAATRGRRVYLPKQMRSHNAESAVGRYRHDIQTRKAHRDYRNDNVRYVLLHGDIRV
eukprot:jgi/Tetstr1/437959/TSEL_026589.t1